MKIIVSNKKLNKNNIKRFFESRAINYDKKNPLKSVIYQDKNPSLAKKRDLFEKKKIKDLINFSKEDVVLDIGCGIGRWGEISTKVKKYVGIDYTEKFIKIAESTFKNDKNTHFVYGDAANFINTEVKYHLPYSTIIIMGFFIYIDNKQGYDVLKQILEVSDKRCQIILKETIGVKNEIVLNNIWSDEMQTHYSGRYRTISQFKQMFEEVLFEKGFKLFIDEKMFPDHLNNREDTTQHLFCLKR